MNPNYLSDELFFDGNALPVDSNISGGGKATFNYTTLSSDNDLAFDWQWSAAVYTEWPGNNQAKILPYHHTDHAGTPENAQVKASLIQGPRGGGGSNFTGSWKAPGVELARARVSHDSVGDQLRGWVARGSIQRRWRAPGLRTSDQRVSSLRQHARKSLTGEGLRGS